MASKHFFPGKRWLITSSQLFFFTFAWFFCTAQDISRYYIASYQQDGILYFINPMKDWHSKKEKADLTFDITYHTANDSLVYNFSLFTKTNSFPQFITIKTGDQSIFSTGERIYIDYKKSKYHYRYSVKFPFREFYQLLQKSSGPPLIIVTLENQQGLILSIRQTKWQEQQDILQKIFNLIAMNIDSTGH